MDEEVIELIFLRKSVGSVKYDPNLRNQRSET